MKIAAITEDGTTISQHFGRAPLYVVVTVEDGKIVNKETRNKAGHHTFAAQHDVPLAPGEKHGYDAGSQVRHASMAEAIADAFDEEFMRIYVKARCRILSTLFIEQWVERKWTYPPLGRNDSSFPSVSRGEYRCLQAS
jgi:predicted Fe-Mo cluster-binding NifX family protein